MEKERIILGVDPGTTITGFGIIKISANKPELITLGVIKLQKFKDPYLKLREIFSKTLDLIDDFHPDELAIEAPFYGKNVQSMLKLGRAQGVSIAAALYRSVPIFEYAPRKIKMSITGRGNASKEQVAGMLQSLLQIKSMPDMPDATDGLAAAMCHYYQSNVPAAVKTFKSWKDYINKNPGKVER